MQEQEKTIKNSNGNEYKVLQEKEKYMLLEKVSGRFGNAYVVAYNWNGDNWEHGNYFDILQEAQNYFNSKI
jgi:hypothetical protein